ncbi:MAG: phosphoribosylamine--glycine ligase N-terminal domain-containing protein, partial [Chloroflexota bacterium]
MRVLVVGSGGREHALMWKLSQSSLVDRLYVAPGNAGTRSLGENLPVSDSDVPGL